MMGKIKKVIASALITALSISLFSGCSMNAETEVLTPVEVIRDEEYKESEDGVKQKTTLTFWSWVTDADTVKAVYEGAIKNFNENNKFNVQIKPSYSPGEPYKTKLQTEMAANNAPDIFNIWAAGKMKPYVKAKRLFPISELMDKDPEWKSRYADGVFDLTTFDGKVYGVPQIRSACVVYYNKDMFARYGLEAPETWSELMKIVETLRRNDKTPFALDGKEPWVSAMYAEYIANRIDPEAYRHVQVQPDWLIPAYLEMGKKVQELAKAGAFPKGTTELDYAAARNLFNQEKAGMFLMGNWDIGYFSTKSPIKDKVGVFKFPTIEGGKGSSDEWLAGVEQVFAVSARSSNPEAACAFLKYLSEPEIAAVEMPEKAGYMSTVKVNTDPSKVSRLYTEIDELLKNSKGKFMFYDVTLGSAIGDEFNNAIQSIIVGKSPWEALKKVDEVAKKEMSGK